MHYTVTRVEAPEPQIVLYLSATEFSRLFGALAMDHHGYGFGAIYAKLLSIYREVYS